MPLPDLFASFLAAALASLIFCFLKIAFDSTTTTTPGSTLLFRQPSALASTSASRSSSPLAAATGKRRRGKGLRVSFEDSAGARAEAKAEAEARRDGDLGALTAREGWVAAGAQGLGLRRGVGRKLSVVLEEGPRSSADKRLSSNISYGLRSAVGRLRTFGGAG